ncbi:cytochrome b5 [Cajanus cajan]|uniref:Cytochrome b5 isoform 2 n=1 Tax=Cajanus cajan TaxID=3821 RepID=A0A151TRX8_CAJCA|nr:cytochrome b5 [Cajanus cajan]KYP69817.1 putative cytochrome b5 isoform 2 [Cajanus cajan]
MPTLTNFYAIEELSQHNTKDDCWILVDGKVYDVTQYLDDHPGGDDVILATTGKDATEEFEDVGHSKSARELMEQYCIGELDTSPPISTKQSYSEKLMQLTKQYWVVPVTVVGISVVVGFLYLRKK